MENRVGVRNHYNQHASENPTFEKAIEARKTGRATPLRNFHNTIKRLLIQRFAKEAPRLLDLCCGRGGDIIKWHHAGVKYVKGLDISEGEIQEARKRFEEQIQLAGKKGLKLNAEFEAKEDLGEKEWIDKEQYDVITCMFALHYFFESQHSFERFLKNVALNLKPGGIFLGTIPSGNSVMFLLGDGDDCEWQEEMLKLEKKWQGKVKENGPFGNAYLCAITDTVTEGKGDSSGSSEYLAFIEPVEEYLAQYHIVPMKDIKEWSKGGRVGQDLERCFDPKDGNNTLKHFAPKFGDDGGAPGLEEASMLNGAFVFRKLTETERVVAAEEEEEEARRRATEEGQLGLLAGPKVSRNKNEDEDKDEDEDEYKREEKKKKESE